jgi:rhodanese-related sulfurtransferase
MKKPNRMEVIMDINVPKISKESLKEHLGDSDIEIIDVRLNWKESNLMIPYAKRENPRDVLSWMDKYSKEKPVVLYCSSPNEQTSADAAGILIRNGFKNVAVLSGGWVVWEASRFPTHNKLADTHPKKLVTDVLKK